MRCTFRARAAVRVINGSVLACMDPCGSPCIKTALYVSSTCQEASSTDGNARASAAFGRFSTSAFDLGERCSSHGSCTLRYICRRSVCPTAVPDMCPLLQVSLQSVLPGVSAAPASQPRAASGDFGSGVVPSPFHPAPRLEVNAGRACVSCAQRQHDSALRSDMVPLVLQRTNTRRCAECCSAYQAMCPTGPRLRTTLRNATSSAGSVQATVQLSTARCGPTVMDPAAVCSAPTRSAVHWALSSACYKLCRPWMWALLKPRPTCSSPS